MAYDERTAQRVRDLLSEEYVVVEKRMFGGLAFMVNGHMCCGVVGEDVVVRVDPKEHQKALCQPHVRPMDFTGRPMKGFVYVSPQGHSTKANLKKWLRKGLTFISSLPAK